MSTDAGTQPAGNGREPPVPGERRGLRDHPLGKVALLALVLLAAVAVSRTCGSGNREVSKDEALAIAIAEVDFTPCEAQPCRQIRFLQRGIPVRGYWGVVLTDELDADGRPSRVEGFLVDAQSGAVTRP